MLCSPISRYPEKIDERIFFQDNDLTKIEFVDYYNKLIAKGRCNEANAYIDQHKNIYGLFPDYLNLIENRICNLQEYLLKKPSKLNPFFYYDKKGYGILIFSDMDEEEDLNLIKLFLSDESEYMDVNSIYVYEDQDSPENLHVFTGDTEMEPDEIEPSAFTENTIWI